jgi:putative ABC transport system ATP-binding protein
VNDPLHRTGDGDAMVRCRDLYKQFGTVGALDRVSLDVAPGEFVALTGPSGCGKSTLLHLIAGLDRPTSGSLVVSGHDLSHGHVPNHFRKHEVGIVFQLHNLLPHMTACENIEVAMFGTNRRSRARTTHARELLDDLGLGHAANRSPARLSGGERQRVAIARALANDPQLLLADEPTGSLDRAAADLVLAHLTRQRDERNLTILMVTHDDAVAHHADRTLELHSPAR